MIRAVPREHAPAFFDFSCPNVYINISVGDKFRIWVQKGIRVQLEFELHNLKTSNKKVLECSSVEKRVEN